MYRDRQISPVSFGISCQPAECACRLLNGRLLNGHFLNGHFLSGIVFNDPPQSHWYGV